MGEDVSHQLDGKVADNIEVEGASIEKCAQLAPFMGGQVGEQGSQGGRSRVRSVQALKGINDASRIRHIHPGHWAPGPWMRHRKGRYKPEPKE